MTAGRERLPEHNRKQAAASARAQSFGVMEKPFARSEEGEKPMVMMGICSMFSRERAFFSSMT